jgi:hypothetical protein
MNMTTRNPIDTMKNSYSSTSGNAVVFTNGAAIVAGDLDLADKINLVFVPAGTLVDEVKVKHADLDTGGTAMAFNLGFAHVDGSAATTNETADATARSLTPATLLAAAATTWTGTAADDLRALPALQGGKGFVASGVLTTAVTTIAAGSVYAKVRGEALGAV